MPAKAAITAAVPAAVPATLRETSLAPSPCQHSDWGPGAAPLRAAPCTEPAARGAVAYLVSRYPAVSHTFILREVQGLRALGLRVEVASVNPPDRTPAQMTRDEQREAEATYTLKRHGAAGAAAALVWALATRPGALWRTLRTALSLGRGLQRVVALAYAAEAAMVLRWMHARGLRHLHVHFGTAAAGVGLLVRTLGAEGLSITIHGPDEFDDVAGQSLPQKVAAADTVVCISQFARSQLMRLTGPAHWAKLKLCRLGVDTQAFAPPAAATDPGPAPMLRLLCVGRLTPAKGQRLLLQACARLREEGRHFHLTLVGDGPDRQALEAERARAGLLDCVSLAGALNQDQVRAEFARADVFVLPSLAEGIPVVLMEAMASGVPVVSCPVNGIPELIEDGCNGLLSRPGDAGALAMALGRLMDDAGLRRRLAHNARATIEDGFHLRRSVTRLAGILAALPTVEARA